MPSQEIHSWTLGGLIGAFIDLVLAYFLLCGSAIAFFASKFFVFSGLYLLVRNPGYGDGGFCVHKLLFEWPSRKICSIQVMAARRFPFELVRSAESVHLNNNNDSNRFVELEDEASGSSFPLENGYDGKGRRIMKRRSGNRRRRRATSYDSARLLSVIGSDDQESDDDDDGGCTGMVRSKSGKSVNYASAKEAGAPDVEVAQTGQDLDEKTCHSYEFNGSTADSPGQVKYSSSNENYKSDVQDNVQILGNGEDRIKMLENALEERKAAYAALYLELEKERAAAATAADEAMAMILRLQEEKASMEMEMRQYHRMIEERVVYDEEEMNILQEILIRRERENHFLEMEIEAYRQICLGGSDESNGKPRVLPDELEQRSPTTHETHEDAPPAESPLSAKKDELSTIETFVDAEDGEEPAENIKHKVQAQDIMNSSFCDTEPDVLDFHVIDDNIEVREQENKKICSSSFNTVSNEPRNIDRVFASLPPVPKNRPRTSKTESGISVDGRITPLPTAASRCKSLPTGSRRASSRADKNERLRLDAEIEILGERLKMIQKERERISLFAENGENEKGQFKLLEEMANQLLQAKQRRNPVRGASLPSSSKNSLRGASLPPPSGKVNSRERRYHGAESS